VLLCSRSSGGRRVIVPLFLRARVGKMVERCVFGGLGERTRAGERISGSRLVEERGVVVAAWAGHGVALTVC